MLRVIFDASFLIDMLKFKVSLESLVEELGHFEKCLLDSTIIELQKIARKKTKNAILARVALQLTKEFKTIKTGKKRFDEAILSLKNNFCVATNDAELRKKLKEKGIKTIYLRAKKKIVIE